VFWRTGSIAKVVPPASASQARSHTRAIHQRSGRSFPWLLQAYRLHASQSAASRARANPVEPSRTNPPMAKLAAIEPVGSSRTEPSEIEQKNKQTMFRKGCT
jgi:hypothetical protein